MRNTREIVRQKWLLKPAAPRDLRVGRRERRGGEPRAGARHGGEAHMGVESTSLDDAELEARLYPSVVAAASRPEPDCTWVHRERHRPGVTLELLHHEYLEQHPDGLRYTTFCDRYREWLGRRGLVMRQVHVAGDKMFVDYSGKKPRIVDPTTGEVIEVELFVAALGASNLTYAEATYTQRSPDWIASHVRGLRVLRRRAGARCVPDQLKSGVSHACRYEPEAQRTYEELAQHYGTTVLPARPLHPRDKAKVEVAVQIAQRWLLARIRDEVFHSIGALNARLRELLVDLNGRVMRRYGKSRRALFEGIERSALRPLPASRFEYAEWQKARVNIDYHVQVDGHLYSVPFRAGARRGRGSSHRRRRGDPARPRARRVAPPLERERRLHHDHRAHAERAPRARGVDAVADPHVGRQGRRGDARAVRRNPR